MQSIVESRWGATQLELQDGQGQARMTLEDLRRRSDGTATIAVASHQTMSLRDGVDRSQAVFHPRARRPEEAPTPEVRGWQIPSSLQFGSPIQVRPEIVADIIGQKFKPCLQELRVGRSTGFLE